MKTYKKKYLEFPLSAHAASFMKNELEKKSKRIIDRFPKVAKGIYKDISEKGGISEIYFPASVLQKHSFDKWQVLNEEDEDYKDKKDKIINYTQIDVPAKPLAKLQMYFQCLVILMIYSKWQQNKLKNKKEEKL
jgi:hypothetical protein